MSEYKPNSHKFREQQQEAVKEERKKVAPVVSGRVTTKKKSDITKFATGLISEEVGDVKNRVLSEVIVPAVKNVIVDAVTDAINMVFFGSTGRSSRSTVGRPSYVSYSKYSDRDRDRGEHRSESRFKDRFDLDDIFFATSKDAIAVREQMFETLESYGFVTVADLYDSAQLSAPWTANKYGWTSLRNADVVHTRDGWMIKLPRPMPID